MPYHTQVPFKTAYGNFVDVDLSMYDILELLRDQGVYTQYSCQGTDKFSAYVLADAKSFLPLIKKALRLHKKGLLSKDANYVMSHLRNGRLELDISHWFKEGSLKFKKGLKKKLPRDYEAKLSMSFRHGVRITIRVVPEDLHKVETLLKELSK